MTQGILTLASRQLRAAGFRQMRATSLREKHVEVLLKRWQAEGLSAGTLKNRLAHLHWWAEKVGKAGVIPADNAQLGIPKRRFVADENKARELGNGLDRIRDPHVHISLSLQEAFGLRREECMRWLDTVAGGTIGQLKPTGQLGGQPAARSHVCSSRTASCSGSLRLN